VTPAQLEVEIGLHETLSLLKLLQASLDNAIEQLPCDHNNEAVELLFGCSCLAGVIAARVAVVRRRMDQSPSPSPGM
jgi:hypothetical protein